MIEKFQYSGPMDRWPKDLLMLESFSHRRLNEVKPDENSRSYKTSVYELLLHSIHPPPDLRSIGPHIGLITLNPKKDIYGFAAQHISLMMRSIGPQLRQT